MTNREFFSAVLSGNISDEVKGFAEASIAKLDARNEKRANTPTKAQIANEPVKEAILDFLASVPRGIASEIASACGVSTQKVSALCKILVENGKVSVTDVKVKGKGTVKAYSIVKEG